MAGSVQVLRPISALSLAKIIWPEYWDSKRHWRLFWTNARNTGCRNTMPQSIETMWSGHSEAYLTATSSLIMSSKNCEQRPSFVLDSMRRV